MRVPHVLTLARLMLALTVALSAVLNGVSLTPPSASNSSAPHAAESGLSPAAAKGQKQKQQKSKSNSKNKQKKDKGDKNRNKKQRNKAVPEALDANAIAEVRQPEAEAFDCAGLEKIEADGRTYCTHGEDPRRISANASAEPPNARGNGTLGSAARPLCIDDGQSGPRVQILYVHRSDRSSRLGEFLTTFRRLASEMDTIVDQSARKTGGALRIRYVTTPQCQVDIAAVAITPGAMDSFSGTINQLAAAGYNEINRKYLILADSNSFCGVGTFLQSDAPETTAHDLTGYARIDTPCWDSGTMVHELGHTMGAVQYSAPHTSRGAHCIDEWDVMCYSDSPFKPEMRYLCGDGAQDFRLDCNDDDYFASQPAPGSYLDGHWNMARSIYFTPGSGEVCPDAALEPDDAYWYAFWEVPFREFPKGGTEARAFCDEPGDTDWFLFQGQSGKTYQIETTNLGPEVDTQLVAYRGYEESGWDGMSTIASNDDRATGDPSSLLTFAAPAASSYLIGVSEAQGRAGLDKTYTISLRESDSPATTASLSLSRTKAKPKRPFTVTVAGLTPTSEITFYWKRGEKTNQLGTVVADTAGGASLDARVPKGARQGANLVGATSSDGAYAEANFAVKKKGGRDNKGGKHYGKGNGKGKGNGGKSRN